MSEINEIIHQLNEFNKERDWEQFHNPKDLAVAINVEAGELLEAFLWKQPVEAKVDKIEEELADVLAFSLLLASKYGFDVKEIISKKLKSNAIKYPVNKSRGSAKKYNEL